MCGPNGKGFMQLDTKFLRLRTPVTIGSRFVRLAGLLAGRLGPRPPVLPGDGREGQTRIVMSLHESCSASARRLEAN